MEVVRFWVTITWSFTVQTAKILTDAYTSRIVRGQSTLKDVIERYLWNGLSRERLKAMKALYALIAMKALCALYAKYGNVLVEKPTLVEKRKMLNLKPKCIYSVQSIEQHYYRETEEQKSNGCKLLVKKDAMLDSLDAKERSYDKSTNGINFTIRKVFDRPPEGVRKIVIATNIAETSITIDDVVFVVDAGKVKEKTYDVYHNIACLQPVWISKASSRQRRGRAGRVQPGYCFHLFTQLRAQSLDDYQLPEMLRTPLEELCLQIKILKLGMIRSFLSKALQPPEEQAVINALESLQQLKALDANEDLTPLGHHLAALPVNPRVGKIILFGAIFSCLDPVLTVASVLGFKDPFVFPLGKQKEAEQARLWFAGDTRSDHLALLKAFQGWETSVRKGIERDYCWRNFLSVNTMRMIKDMKQQFSGLLYDIGFLQSSNPKASSANYNSDNLKLVKAILCAGLYPNVASINHHPRFSRPPKLRTHQDGTVYLHPKSVNAEVRVYEDNWLIYHEKMKSTSLFLYDSTMIAPFPLLFFGGEISVFVEEGYETVAIDDFIKFKSPNRIANLVKELRVELDKLLRQKIAKPDTKLSVGTGTGNRESALLRAIIDLITSEENTNWRKQRALATEAERT